MERRVVNPWTWQDQYGFVQANEVAGADRVLYCSGLTSLDAAGQPVHDGDMRAQAVQALDNLEVVLAQAGFALRDVMRLNFYVTDIPAFLNDGSPAINARLAAASCRYVSTLLGVANLALPEHLIEIEATAAR